MNLVAQMKTSNPRALACIIAITWLSVFLASQTSAQQINECNGATAPTCNPNRRFRTLSGRCNNLQNPFFGSVNTAFRRLLQPDYADGRSEPRESQRAGVPLPNPREVSLAVFRDRNRPSPRLSHMAMVFGQFLAHDITLGQQPEGVECEVEPTCQQGGECVSIPIPPGDPRFPGPEGVSCIRVVRDEPCDERQVPRQQVNILTSYIDASHIYGTNSRELDDISNSQSLHPLGLLATVPQNNTGIENLLPKANPHTLCLTPDPDNRPCFVTGDFRRNNENSALNSLHTIWVREHNRIALQLHWLNPSWTGGRLFQEARRIVGALMQHITYNEFLPIMLGPDRVKEYKLGLETGRRRFTGYDPSVDPSIPNAMAAAALRFGHSTVRNIFSRFVEEDNRVSGIRVKEFHNPEFLYDIQNGGIDSIIRGLAIDPAQNIDAFFSNSILNNVIQEDGRRADLMAVNIQRGREHGLPGYNKFRAWCDLGKATRFSDFSNTITRAEFLEPLQRAYRSVDDVDLFVGGISESPSGGGGLGPTFACILGNGFRELRLGDRFWYETDETPRFTRDQLEQLRKASLARIICDNSDGISEIQPRVLLRRIVQLPDGQTNRRTKCENLPFVDLNAWKR